jgi:hypothetical protein
VCRTTRTKGKNQDNQVKEVRIKVQRERDRTENKKNPGGEEIFPQPPNPSVRCAPGLFPGGEVAGARP